MLTPIDIRDTFMPAWREGTKAGWMYHPIDKSKVMGVWVHIPTGKIYQGQSPQCGYPRYFEQHEEYLVLFMDWDSKGILCYPHDLREIVEKGYFPPRKIVKSLTALGYEVWRCKSENY